MTYFNDFPRTFYQFGESRDKEVIENISIYADVVDQVRNATTAYQDYYIQSNERPDQVSFKLYETPHYHWTFYLMNPKLRECGWPHSQQKIYEQALKLYNETVLTTRTKLTDKLKIGQTITGLTTGVTAKVSHREIDLGQLWIKDATGTFSAGETITSTNSDGITESITLHSTEVQYNAAHHYENADKEYVDIDPEVGPGSNLTEITWLDRLITHNETLREIKIIRPNIITRVAEAFREAVKQ